MKTNEQLELLQPQLHSTFRTLKGSNEIDFLSVWHILTSPGCNVSDVPDHLIGLHLGAPVTITHWRDGLERHHRFRRGDVVFAPAGSPVCYAHAEPVDALYINISPNAVDEVAVQLGIDLGKTHLANNWGTSDPNLARMGREVLAEIGSPGLGSRLLLETMSTQIIIHLLRHYTVPSPTHLDYSEDHDVPALQARLQPVIDYMMYPINRTVK
ncbi:MAG: hypothetical protein L6Q98_24935 [Anaerolineae bacterium]|nr:hypothetical protein [Anaerolineae bacterium]NUQ07122.1 hypothetical protein [Anaerolineae bacterium]